MLALWGLDEELAGSIPDRPNLENDIFDSVCSLVGSVAPAWLTNAGSSPVRSKEFFLVFFVTIITNICTN